MTMLLEFLERHQNASFISSHLKSDNYRAALNFFGSLILRMGDCFVVVVFYCFAGTNFCDWEHGLKSQT